MPWHVATVCATPLQGAWAKYSAQHLLSLLGWLSTYEVPSGSWAAARAPCHPTTKRPRKVRERRDLCRRPLQAQARFMVALLPRCPQTGCPCHPCSPRNPGLKPNLHGRAAPPTPTPGPQPCMSTGADGRGRAGPGCRGGGVSTPAAVSAEAFLPGRLLGSPASAQ